MGRKIIMPGGSFEFEYSQLRRAVRVVPQADVFSLLQNAVVTALRNYNKKFWEELFMEEGEKNCVMWAKLVGLYDPGHAKCIRALSRRRDGDASEWLALTGVESPPPAYPPFFDFMSDDMTGHFMHFDDLI